MGLNRKHFSTAYCRTVRRIVRCVIQYAVSAWTVEKMWSSSDEVQVPRGGTFTLDCPFNGVYVALNFEKNGKRKLIYSRVGFGNFTFKRDGWKDRLTSFILTFCPLYNPGLTSI